MENLKLYWGFVSLLLVGVSNFVSAQEPNLGVATNGDEFHSSVRINTCCALDLDSEDVSCDNRDGGKSEEWTFSGHMLAENVSTRFQLNVQKIQCKDNPTVTYIPRMPRSDNTTRLLKNGYLKVEKEYYPPAEYCINGINDTDLEIMHCPQTCTGNRPCIKKCCSLDKVYSVGVDGTMGKGCQSHKGDYFKPTFYDSYSKPSTHNIPDSHFIENYPRNFKYACPGNRTIMYVFPDASKLLSDHFGLNFNGLVFRVRENGEILFKHQKDGKCDLLEPEANFCIDAVVNYGATNMTVNDTQELVLFQCILSTEENNDTKRVFGLIYGGLMLSSSIFLLLTILTYIALWDRQSVHGWTIVSHTVSLFFMYIFLGIAHIIGVTSAHDYLGSPGCIGIGILTHFFFLATFCWLFLISVDLWLTFRAFTPRSGTRSKGVSRYIKYSIFGWGVPILFVIIGIILDSNREADCHTYITPAYGRDSCFPQQKALGVYLYYPVGVMISLNLILFTITTFKLYLYRESTKMATKDDKTQFYRLFFKLFFIMGVLWVFEVISWAWSGNGYHLYWIAFDMLNVLRAVAVFVIFVCKPDIIFSLEEKYPWLKPALRPFFFIFKKNLHGDRDPTSSVTRSTITRSTITRTSTLDSARQGKAESIGLIVNSNKFQN